MEKEVRKDILRILQRTMEILKQREEKDVLELKDLSDHTLHDASIYKHLDPVAIAIITYSLYKFLERGQLISAAKQKKLIAEFEQAHNALGKNKFGRYNEHIQNIFSLIKRIDRKATKYIQEVMDKARVTKGSKLFAHGLSAKRAAEIMGTTEWELLKYIGQTKTVDTTEPGAISTKKRLTLALNLFSK